MVQFKCTYTQVMDATMHHIGVINKVSTQEELVRVLTYSEHIYRAARLVNPDMFQFCNNIIKTCELRKYREIVSSPSH